jgi:hypothetical protein
MLRFTIRDVLWLTALIAVGVGWFVDRRAVVRERDWAFEFSRKQAIDLQMTEYCLLDLAKEDFDIENLRSWAKQRRAERAKEAAARELTRKKS